MCYVRIPDFGYWYWKLCPKVDANFTYTIGSPGRNIDMFLFDRISFLEYRKDINRKKPRNYGYYPMSTQLATENGYGQGLLDGGQCYYFVVDYTRVGAATQNQWDPTYIYYQLTGNPADEYGSWGTGQFGAASLPTASRLLLVALAVLAFLFS